MCKEKVNHQLLAALKKLAGHVVLDNQYAFFAMSEANDAIAAAEAAQPVVRDVMMMVAKLVKAEVVRCSCPEDTPRDWTYRADRIDLADIVDSVLTDCKQPASAQPVAVPDGARKVFICDVCEGVYADEPVTNCDCTVSEKTTFSEGYIVMLSAASNP